MDVAARRWWQWLWWLIGTLAALAFLVWAGSQTADRWNWTVWSWTRGAEWAELPRLVPGVVWLWLAATGAYTVLSLGVWMLRDPNRRPGDRNVWLNSAWVLILAAAVRWMLLQYWSPPTTTDATSLCLMAVDLAAIAALIWLLARRGQSVLWAATYAWHPLVCANLGLGSTASLGTALLVALAWFTDLRPDRLHLTPKQWRCVKTALAIAALAALIALGQESAGPNAPPTYEGFLPYLIRKWWVIDNTRGLAHLWWISAGVTVLLQAALLAWATWRQWPIARLLGHAIVLAALCWPTFAMPWVLWALAASVLAWNRATWLMSGLVLGLWAQNAGAEITDWLMVLLWLPVAVVQAQQLLMGPAANQTSAPVCLGAGPPL